MMTQPRKHHYLPQFYLRGFSEDQRSIVQIEKATGNHYICQIKDTAAIRDFHEIDADNVEDPYALEKLLAQVESELANHLRALLIEGLSNTISLGEVIGLLSMLRVRVPAVREHIEGSLASTIRAKMKLLEQANRLPKPPPGLAEALRVDNLQIAITNWKCMEIMFGMAASPDILNILSRMRVTLYRCDRDQFFITCDQPVALLHPSVQSTGPYGAGPGITDVEITLPLAHDALIHLDHVPGSHREKSASPADVEEFNRRTIIMAQNFIFTGRRPEVVVQQLTPLRNTFAGFCYDDLHPGGQFFQLQRFIPVSPQSIKPGEQD